MKQGRAGHGLWPHLLFALICLAAGPARAGCTNPTNNEGDLIYNTAYHTYQYCDGTKWNVAGQQLSSLPPLNIFGSTVPVTSDGGPDSSVNLGTVFYSTVAGSGEHRHP
jgi:hypothetical protein